MASICSVLPEFPLPRQAEPGAGEDASETLPAVLDASRNAGEHKLSRAFQRLALMWLDKLLSEHPNLKAVCRNNQITILPPTTLGFATTLSVDRGRCKVLLGPCSKDFGSVVEATMYMTAAIRGDLRLRVDLNWRPYRWRVECHLPDGSWADDLTIEIPKGSQYCAPPHSCYFRN